MDLGRSGIRRIGVCSWSLGVDGPEAIAHVVRDKVGVSGVQLSVSAMVKGGWGAARTKCLFDQAGIEILSGMLEPIGEDYTTIGSIRRTGGFVLDEVWEENLEHARAVAESGAGLGLGLVTTHVGAFVHADGALDERMVDRVRTIARVFAEHGIQLGMESGQESAVDVVRLIEAVGVVGGVSGAVGVNFDPANMLLYGAGDPIEGLRVLIEHVAQCHIKDAVASGVAGQWGNEVPAGTGEVDWDALFDVLAGNSREVDVIIERESGDNRVGDLRRGADLVRAHCEGGEA